MKTTRVNNLFMILSVAVLAACAGPPSVGDIEEQLESALNGDAGVGVKIVTVDNFEKLNGFEKSEKTYIAEVKYDLVVSKDAKDFIQQNTAQDPLQDPLGALAAVGYLAVMEHVAGQKLPIQDTVALIKTEKGWVLTQWHPEAIENAIRERMLQRMVTALSEEQSENTDGNVKAQLEKSQDTLASQQAEMKRVMEERARIKAENEEAKRQLENQQASVQNNPVTATTLLPQNVSQPDSTPAAVPATVPNFREATDFHDSAGNPLVAEMITAALANDNGRIIEIRDQLLSQPKPQRGDRKRARALNDEGLSYFNTQEFDKAVASFQLATKMDPGDIEIINNFGYALMEAGRLRESEQALMKTLLMAPDRTSAWANYSGPQISDHWLSKISGGLRGSNDDN